MSPKSIGVQMQGWIKKVRCSKKLESEIMQAIEVTQETYPEYVRKSVEQRNKKVLQKNYKSNTI